MACPRWTIIEEKLRGGDPQVVAGLVADQIGVAAKAHCLSTGNLECGVGRIKILSRREVHHPPNPGPPPTTDEYEVTIKVEVYCEKQAKSKWMILLDAFWKAMQIWGFAYMVICGSVTVFAVEEAGGPEIVDVMARIAVKAAR